MLYLLIGGFIFVPFVMTVLAVWSRIARYTLHWLALLSFYMAGSIITAAVYRNIMLDTVLTTNIHNILMNPWFLAAGSYIGLYIPFRLLTGFWNSRHP
ncbi:hypothetical protein [Paenibacillus azoreducens]|uniref:Uncharacterized protein n=1 Tax=Paenibacillus azoreducens TaxID=116718 RepID=A0A919Y8L9_9BACL|nr:hypothetical protein [Paenibacillus azoreducens]GIO46637.1 hypothetical protein J34TS1_14020 [Paenibacillus azoreducens]